MASFAGLVTLVPGHEMVDAFDEQHDHQYRGHPSESNDQTDLEREGRQGKNEPNDGASRS